MLERLWYLLLATAGLFIITIHGSLLENDANESPPTCDFDLAVDVAEALRYSPQGLDYGTLTWIHNTDGGYYNPKQEFRTENPNDPNSLVGVFAKERIEIGELLCRVPSTHWITGITNESEHSQLCCDMVRKLALNMKLGNESKFSPYIRYLNEQPENQIPSVWSTQAQDLLLQVMGQTRDENNQSGEKSAMFPPSKVAAWIEEGWYGRCQGNHHDDVERKAALMALLRADDEIMIPAYDFYNHRNGEWHNADSERDQEFYETRAWRVIEPGEQIFISYNRCPNCGGRKTGYGAAEILRDYGFVENFPQHWHYYRGEIAFDLHYLEKEATYEVEWIGMPSSNRVKNIQYWLRQQVRRLERLWHITYQPQTTEDNGISMQEWNTIWTFHKANLLAMKCLINAMNGLNHTCAAKANEITPMDALYHNFHAEDPWDAVDLKVPPWKSKEFRSYPFVDSALSFIQSIDISATDFPTRDVCLYRNHNLHVCSSFRPTYYEYFMHPAASLLKSIRRVLIIGHGAAFLLQEAMKYSSTLDLLVLIEPDQTMAFMVHRHFGVDLHLNDPRVEWCFGDVEETLSMMPEQYWSSFDLVLLDMDKSDFSSFSCKEKKLSDLVHEGGIFVSHKNHVVEMGNDFAFTSCLIHQSTKRSKQIYTLGSHSVDFLHAKSMDHEIKTLIYEPSLMSSHRLSLLRDFTNLASLASPVVSEGKEFIQTNSTHVVLNLVEIINVTTSLEEIISSLQEALILHDFTLHTIIQFSTTEAIVLKMEEGYMIARRKVSMDYLGLDIYLWKKQSQLSELKAAIVERLGTATSNFRLAPFGIKSAVSRVSDENHRNKVPTYPLEPLNHSIIEKFLEAVEKIFVQSPVKALLVCESVNDCPSREWIKDLYFVGSLFELEMCSTRSQDDEGQRMIACDRHIRDWIERTLQSIGILIDVIFVDGGLSSRSLQVLDGILNVDSRSRQSWIADSNLLLALPTYLDFSSEDNSFTDWFHQRSGLPDGVNANFVVFDNYGRRLSQIRLVSSMGMGDTRRRMQELESMVDEELNKVDLRVQLQRLRGASIRPRDLLPVRRFGHEDYQVTSVDITSPTIQVGVQDFTRVQGATNRTEIVAAIRMALESTIRQEVKMRVTDDKEPANVFVFEFDSGNLVIVLFENSAMDLNMFYECSEVDCQETDEIIDDFFDRMFQEHSAWQPLSVNTMTRGSKRS